ncbi:beta-agarase [Vibrio sp. WXL103]|uniref:beta-agarase n=1 Tax=Vibrio sp. WXL103 TaxID=3450710 RepID=UPI003EC508A1
MKFFPITAITTALFLLSPATAEIIQVMSFEDSESAYKLSSNGDATQSITTQHATDGNKSWQVDLGTSWQGSVNIYNENGGQGWDWGSKTRLAFDVTNTGQADINFGIKVLSNFTWAANDVLLDYRIAKPGTHTYEISLDSSKNGEVGDSYNKAKVNTLQFFAAQISNANLFIDNIRVAQNGDQVTPPTTPPDVVPIPGRVSSAPVKTLLQVEDFNELPSYLNPNNVSSVSLVEQGVSIGSHALEVVFPPGKMSSWVLAPGVSGTIWNWSDLGENGEDIAFAIDITNPNDFTIHPQFLLTDQYEEEGYQIRYRAVPANDTQTVYISLNDLPDYNNRERRLNQLGMAVLPAVASDAYTPAIDWHLKLDQVYKLRFRLNAPQHDEGVRVIYDNARIIKDFNHDNAYVDLVDHRGQNNQVTHYYKVAKSTDLASLGEAEAELLGELSGAARNSNGYGSHPSLMPDQNCRLNNPGFFNACQDDSGKWHLVDPEGYAFFSSGIANIRMADTFTMTGTASDGNDSQLRQAMFTELPTHPEYIRNNYGPVHAGAVKQGQAVSFYGNNIVARHGSEPNWRDITQRRFKDWGFNTLGNWTDPAFYPEASMPFAVAARTDNCSGAKGCGTYNRIGSGYWSGLPDPWDPQFKTNVELMATETKSQISGNEKMVLGIYVDNELSWGTKNGPYSHKNMNYHVQTMAVFAADATQEGAAPAKSVFINEIIPSDWGLGYANISALNAAWGTNFNSFDEMKAPFDFVNKTGYNGTNAQITADLDKLQYYIALQYFKTINDALKAELPNHLYLGVRFADFGRTPQVISVAGEHVDVMSFNVYEESIAAKDWDAEVLEQIKGLNIPAIIGEFHFGALDSGSMASGLISASNQVERAEKLVTYLESVNTNPQFVGAHWFQYIDQPLPGRAWDGATYNVGFVNATDTPYPEMVDAARRFNCYVYDASLKERCESELVAGVARSSSTDLYTGNNVGELHRGPQAPAPEDEEDDTDNGGDGNPGDGDGDIGDEGSSKSGGSGSLASLILLVLACIRWDKWLLVKRW